MRYLHWTNDPGKVWTMETIFFLNEKKCREFCDSGHHKTAKLLNMAPILPILKILQ